MHVVVRIYSGHDTSEGLEKLEAQKGEVRDILAGVPGFVSYNAFRTGGDSYTTVTVCESEEGTKESSKRAAEWVRVNLENPGTPSDIVEGMTFLSF